MIARRDENSASGALCELLRASPLALRTFWSLTRGASAPKVLPKGITIDHRHRTDQQREIDILLHSGPFGVVVECKVGDEKKAYQLDAYAAYWRRIHNVTPHLVWLLERDRPVLGDQRFPVTTITWAQLCGALLDAAKKAATNEKRSIITFCDDITAADIGKPARSSPQMAKVAKGYDPGHAETILQGILDASPGLDGDLLTINALSPAIHAGLGRWSSVLGDEWVQRVWLYFSPLDKTARGKGAYHFHAQVLLYHRGFGDKKARGIPQIPRWAETLRRSGLAMRRNRSGTWNHGVDLQPGEGVGPGVCYILGEEPLADAKGRFPFNWQDDDAAISAGATHLAHYVELLDHTLQQ